MSLRRSMMVVLMAVAYGALVSAQSSVIDSVQAVERRLAARVGLFVHDIHTGAMLSYHADDRFPLNSTFKTLACAALLAQIDDGHGDLSDLVTFTRDDLVTYSPVTQQRVGAAGMTLGELCQATLAVSDNTAANLVLQQVGGPAGLTEFLRSSGDDMTRLDRWEPELNQATPGDLRDTTTPRAMAQTMQRLVLGDLLSPASRQQLEDWIVGHELGDALIRAAVRPTWKVGDRTGAGGHGSRSLAAVIWPSDREPLIVTIYITETLASFEQRNAAIAEIGRAVVQAIAER